MKKFKELFDGLIVEDKDEPDNNPMTIQDFIDASPEWSEMQRFNSKRVNGN